jgi:hypothetical protein
MLVAPGPIDVVQAIIRRRRLAFANDDVAEPEELRFEAGRDIT